MSISVSLYERHCLPTPVDIDEYRCVYLSKYIYIYLYICISEYLSVRSRSCGTALSTIA